MPDQYSITGTISVSGTTERAGLVVQAFDRDLPSVEARPGWVPQRLGAAAVDAEGRFQIAYTLDRFEAGEGSSPFRRSRDKDPDVSFSVLDRAGRALRIRSIDALNRGFGPEQVIFNAPAALEVTIVLEAGSDAGTTEYEQLVELLAPALLDLPLADLTAGDLAFLVSELGLDDQRDVQQRIEWLRSSAAMARDTGLPTDAFYAWARTDLPELWNALRPGSSEEGRGAFASKVVDELAVTPAESLVSHLIQAVDGRIVPVRIRERAEALANAIRRRIQQVHGLRLRLVRDATGEPLAATTVTVFDVDAGNRDLGTDVTDAQGEIETSIFADVNATEINVRVRVPGRSGGPPIEVAQRVPITTDDAVVIRLMIAEAAPALADARGRIDVDDTVLQALADAHGIRSFADIRRRGGLARIEALRGLDAAAIARLDALADLDRLSADLAETTALLARRYASVADVAYASRREFVAAMTAAGAPLTERRAIELHVAATAQVEILTQILAGRVADLANGIVAPAPAAPSGDQQHG